MEVRVSDLYGGYLVAKLHGFFFFFAEAICTIFSSHI